MNQSTEITNKITALECRGSKKSELDCRLTGEESNLESGCKISGSSEKWYTLQEIADGCSVTVQTVRKWFASKRNSIFARDEQTKFDFRSVPNPHGGHPITQVNEYGKEEFIAWLAKNQLSQGRNSSTGSAAVEYVTKEAVQSIVSAAVEAATKPLLETISVLQEDNKKLHEQITQLLEAPKSQALSAPKSEFANGPLLPSEFNVPNFFKALDFPLELQNPFYTKPSPLESGRICNDDFPLKTVSAFKVYVRYVVSQGMSEAQRLDWIQTHPSWAQKIGY